MTETFMAENADSASGLRILLVTRVVPHPPDGGAAQRTQLLYRALAELGTVDTLLVGSDPRPSFAEAQRLYRIVDHVEPTPRGAHWPWRWLRPLRRALVDKLATALGRRRLDYELDPPVARTLRQLIAKHDYDVIVGRYLRPFAKASPVGLAPTIVDLDDVDTDVYATRMQQPGVNPLTRALFRSHYHQTQRVLAEMCGRFSHVWIAKEEDRAKITAPSVSVLPNIPFTPADNGDATTMVEAPPVASDNKRVLFIGSAGHRVNRDAIARFMKACWPQVCRDVPGAELAIVGAGDWRWVEKFAPKDGSVRVIGFVDDLADAYAQCAFAIAPIFEGGGTKIKVMEAYHYGRAMVATTHAAGGFTALADAGALSIAETEDELAQACVRLLRDPGPLAQMAHRGQQVIREQFNYARFRDEVHATVTTALDRWREAAPAQAGAAVRVE